MENRNSIPHHGVKAFYLFLCSILGALLFVILQRALALIYLLLLNNDFEQFSFGINQAQLQLLNYATVILAAVFGLWYGIWLGLYWYRIVYEEGHGGLFHGFRGHWLQHEGLVNKVNKRVVSVPSAMSAVATELASKTIKPAARFSDNSLARHWEFDDLMKPKTVVRTQAQPVAKASVKKRVVKKAIHKGPSSGATKIS